MREDRTGPPPGIGAASQNVAEGFVNAFSGQFAEGCWASRWATAKRYGTMTRTRRRRGTSERRGGAGHQAARGRTPPRRGMANLKRAGPVGATTTSSADFAHIPPNYTVEE